MQNKLTSKIKIWILAIRLKTLWISIAPIFMGTAIAYVEQAKNVQQRNEFFWYIFILVLTTGMLMQILANLVNDYYDYKRGADSKGRLGPKRVMQAKMISPLEMRIFIVIVGVMAFVLGCYLSFLANSLIIFLLLIVCLFFAYAYTGGKYPLAYKGFGDVLAFVFFGPVAVLGTIYLLIGYLFPQAFLWSVAPGLFAAAILSVNNLRDIQQDKIANKITLAVLCGRRFTRLQYTFSVLIAIILPVLFLQSATTFWHFFWICTWVLLSLGCLIFLLLPIIWRKEGAILNKVLVFTSIFLFAYSLCFAFVYVHVYAY